MPVGHTVVVARHLRRAAALAALTAALVPASAHAKTVWLCRPGLAENPCTAPLAATALAADGSSTPVAGAIAAHPSIDCFYVYPTISPQPTLNSDLRVEPSERTVAGVQAGRFSADCRVFAPMYRQITLAGIFGRAGPVTKRGRRIPYEDVAAAWTDYLAHDNHGRGVVLIGHSQGTSVLKALVKDKIDDRPDVRRLLVSALLIGGDVTVAKGRGVGGDFHHVPACRAPAQTGCVIAYSTYLEKPPNPSLFGRVPGGSATLGVLCTNPAALGGGTGALQPFFRQAGTPAWITYPGLYTAHCAKSGDASWLQIDAAGAAGDPRPRVEESLGPIWGLHVVDVNLLLGNLVDDVRREAAAFTRRQPWYAPRSSAIMAGAVCGPSGVPEPSEKPISRCGPVEMPTIPAPTSLMTCPALTWVPIVTALPGPACP